MNDLDARRAESERLLALLPEVRQEVMRIPGVERVSVGLRERGGQVTREMVFRVHVRRKLPESEVPAGEMIPASIFGVPIDVIVRRMPEPETGFNDENDSKKYRPVCGGISISAEDAVPEIGATLGCICRRTTDNKVVALSNWHVLIDPNGAVGKPAGQPLYRSSCCCDSDVIGEILDFDKPLDCAIATINSKIGWAPKIRRIKRADGTVEEEGIIKGSGVPVPGDDVYKVGIRTGYTRGMITDVDPDRVEVTPDAEYTRMSNKGDSGSVYVSKITGHVVALHRAGDGHHGFGVPFGLVKTRLNIDVIPTPPQTHYDVAEHDADELLLHPPYDALAARLAASDAGRQLLQLMRTHRDELLFLVNHRRRVTVTWQRCHGPAWLAALGRSGADPAYRIPASIDGLDRATAIHYIGDALEAHGSPALATALAEHRPTLGPALAECDSADDLLRRWEETLSTPTP